MLPKFTMYKYFYVYIENEEFINTSSNKGVYTVYILLICLVILLIIAVFKICVPRCKSRGRRPPPSLPIYTIYYKSKFKRFSSYI